MRNAAGTLTLATYTYDPLDRLRPVSRAGTTIRFRYVGLTTGAAQVVDHGTSAVSRHIGTDWTGGRLLDWTGSGSNLRVYGTNGHHDVTWTAGDTGGVTTTLRYGAFGETASTTGSSVPDFRYQGTWFDTTTSLAWIITRWYAPSLGRFISEDTLLGQPVEPDSRHLYAYAAGEPIGAVGSDGRAYYSTIYGNAKSDSWSTSFRNPKKVKGRFVLALFIRESGVGVPVPGGWLRGDDRLFSSGQVDCVKSRACITVDFTNSRVSAVVRPTCGKYLWFDTECSPAYLINAGGNWISFNESDSGSVRVTWKLLQSRIPTPRWFSIDGYLQIRPPGTRDPGIRLTGDGFPSTELIYYRSTRQYHYARIRERDPGLLAPWVGDWTKDFAWKDL